MIRSFLSQLLAELRVRHAEHTPRKGGKLDPELAAALRVHAGKYGTTLLACVQIDSRHAIAGETENATAMLGAHLVKTSSAQIAALEMLEPLFQEAVFCAERGGVMIKEQTPCEVIQAIEAAQAAESKAHAP